MTTVSIEVGAVTPTSARVIARTTGTTPRLAVSASADISSPVYFTPDSTASDGAASITATGLTANTQYYYAIEDGTLDLTVKGRFRTHAPIGTPWSHTIATIGDAGLAPAYPGSGSELVPTRISNALTFDTVRLADPLMVVHLGDRAYYDLGPDGNHGVVGGGSLSNYRRMYTDILLQSRQHQLVREIPSQYMWDNHDYGLVGPYADGDHPGKANAAAAYRERVAHYPTAEPSGSPYQAWQVGRIAYILSDTRYNRSPSGVPDGPGKTMLGQAQLGWMFNLLQTTTAEALVWLMPTPWLHDDGGLHHWGSFTYERDQIVEFLTTTTVPASLGSRTWAESMVQVTADIHALGLCSPGHNPFGGFPVMLCASIDATPHHGNEATYDAGYQGGREQWGTVGVEDTGSQITLTLTGWFQANPWGSQSLEIDTSGVTPVDPAPPPVGRAILRAAVEWIACDTVTGDKVAYLSGMRGTISRALGAYTSDTLTVPAPLAGPLALGGLLEQSVGPDQLPTRMIVCIINDLPAWAGLIWKVRGGTGARIELGCSTPESYLDRRYIGDHQFTQVDQASIAATLVNAVNTEGIGLEIDAPLTGVLRDRTYWDDEDATYYGRLQELMDVENGLEWTIDLDWRTDRMQSVRLIYRSGLRIGSTTPRGPLATESKAVTQYSATYDYGKGMGANDVLAYSSGEGADRPQSQHLRNTFALEQGIPRVEHRWSPSSSIKDTTVLNAHAAAALARLDGGSTSLEITSRWNIEPARLGIDMSLGDDIEYALVGHMHPNGLYGTARMVGWRLDPLAGTFEPVLRL